MKKLFIALAFTALGMAAAAQTLNVQSAIRDLQSASREKKADKAAKYLTRAKEEIDAACQHESTKGDAKTWCYKGLIYSQIGGNEAYATTVPDWCEQAASAAMECKRLDKDNEFAANNNTVFRFVGQEYYQNAVKTYNDVKDYNKAMELCEQAINMFNESGEKKYTDDAYYLAGLCAKNIKDNEALAKYFKPLVRRKTEKSAVYRTLFNMYKADGKNDESMKIANSYVKNFPDNYDATLLLAEGYLLNQNMEKANEQIEKALNQTRENPKLYSQILSQAAAVLEVSKNFEGAEAKYKESLSLNSNQYEANFGLGSMIFNRAVDKLDAANAINPDDDPEGELYTKLEEESKEFFRQSIQYFQAAVAFIDGITDADAKTMQRANLHNCLNALKTVYARLEMYNELKPVNARIAEIENAKIH